MNSVVKFILSLSIVLSPIAAIVLFESVLLALAIVPAILVGLTLFDRFQENGITYFTKFVPSISKTTIKEFSLSLVAFPLLPILPVILIFIYVLTDTKGLRVGLITRTKALKIKNIYLEFAIYSAGSLFITSLTIISLPLILSLFAAIVSISLVFNLLRNINEPVPHNGTSHAPKHLFTLPNGKKVSKEVYREATRNMINGVSTVTGRVVDFSSFTKGKQNV